MNVAAFTDAGRHSKPGMVTAQPRPPRADTVGRGFAQIVNQVVRLLVRFVPLLGVRSVTDGLAAATPFSPPEKVECPLIAVSSSPKSSSYMTTRQCRVGVPLALPVLVVGLHPSDTGIASATLPGSK